MRVIVHPGTVFEAERSLCNVIASDYDASPHVRFGLLIEMLVEKGVLTLTDCMALGAPFMKPVASE